MRRGTGFLLVVVGAMVLALGAPRAREGLAQAELFRVDQVLVEGIRYLGAEEVVAAGDVREGASIWEDLDPIARRLQEHSGIREARVVRKLPGTLVLQVTEREPVGLFPDPALTPVDVEGRLLPYDPALHRFDLPLIQPGREQVQGHVREGEAAGDPARLSPAQIRTVASELHLLGELDPALFASISEVALDARGDVLLHLGEPRVTLHYRPPLTPRRLREGLVVLADVLARTPDRRPAAVDLRFADQVVVRFSHL